MYKRQVPKRELLISEIAGWFGDSGSLHPVATYNLLLSSVPLVERGLGLSLIHILSRLLPVPRSGRLCGP